ncbi:MAG: adenylyl-sulfate kinase [Candidatus Latescibacteria bacterium]|nr:adenylyl-sulfate kinase [Candidatus Latescibacterota bacterium]
MLSESQNIVWHDGAISRNDREMILDQRGCVVWFTGLSGSGKSTIACALEKKLITLGHLAYVLDGDNIRHNLNSDLGFSPEDRRENVRRIGELAVLFADAGLITVTALISPYRDDRDRVRRKVGQERFIEIFLDVSLDICERRDVKGLYKKVRNGEISDFTGIDAPYEKPLNPEILIDTSRLSVEECVNTIMRYFEKYNILRVP